MSPSISHPSPPAGCDLASARLLLQQLLAALEREARRAGRGDAFVCLQPYLHADPMPDELASLAATLQQSPPSIELALASLRRRLRERVAAALDKWAGSPDSRDTLRRHLRAALTEQTP